MIREPTPPYHPPNPVQRLVVAGRQRRAGLVIGAVIATVTAFALAVIVTTMTDLLKQ